MSALDSAVKHYEVYSDYSQDRRALGRKARLELSALREAADRRLELLSNWAADATVCPFCSAVRKDGVIAHYQICVLAKELA